MLPQIDALPCAEGESSIANRNGLGCFGERATNVRRHVVRAFVIVLPASRFGHDVRHPVLQVSKHRRIRIFLDNQACRGVLNEHETQPGGDTALGDHVGYIASDVVKGFGIRGDREGCLQLKHGSQARRCAADTQAGYSRTTQNIAQIIAQTNDSQRFLSSDSYVPSIATGCARVVITAVRWRMVARR